MAKTNQDRERLKQAMAEAMKGMTVQVLRQTITMDTTLKAFVSNLVCTGRIRNTLPNITLGEIFSGVLPLPSKQQEQQEPRKKGKKRHGKPRGTVRNAVLDMIARLEATPKEVLEEFMSRDWYNNRNSAWDSVRHQFGQLCDDGKIEPLSDDMDGKWRVTCKQDSMKQSNTNEISANTLTED